MGGRIAYSEVDTIARAVSCRDSEAIRSNGSVLINLIIECGLSCRGCSLQGESNTASVIAWDRVVSIGTYKVGTGNRKGSRGPVTTDVGLILEI